MKNNPYYFDWNEYVWATAAHHLASLCRSSSVCISEGADEVTEDAAGEATGTGVGEGRGDGVGSVKT